MSPVVAVAPEAMLVGGCAAVNWASVVKLPRLVEVFVPLLLPEEPPPLDELLPDEVTPELEPLLDEVVPEPELELDVEPLPDDVAPELEPELLDAEAEESIVMEAVEGVPKVTPLPESESAIAKLFPAPYLPTNGIVIVLGELSPSAQVKVPCLGE